LADATLLLLAMVLGAIVVLAVLRLSQDESRSMRASSADLLRLASESLMASSKVAQESLHAEARELARDRILADLRSTVEKLDTSVGNLVLNNMGQGRTVLTKALQVGEAPPGSPGIRVSRVQPDLPPEGLVPPPNPGSSPVADLTRKTAFAEPT